MPKCNKCGKEIKFIKTKKNSKWIPVDDHPVIVEGGQDVGSVLTPEGVMVNTTYTPFNADTLAYHVHFGTCKKR